MAVPKLVEGYIDSFIQAQWVWARGLTPIDYFGIHTPEGPETRSYAEDLGRYFEEPCPRVASTHFGTDSNSTVRYATDNQYCASARGVNRNGVHVEIAGRAGQSAAGWADSYSQKAMRRAARLFALYHEEYGIPIRIVTRKQLRAGKRGIVKHVDSDAVFGGDHWDPGPNFPDAQFLAMCREEVAILKGRNLMNVELEEWNKVYNKLPEGPPETVPYNSLVELVQTYLVDAGVYHQTHGRKTRSMGEAIQELKHQKYGSTNPSKNIGKTLWADILAEMWKGFYIEAPT